MGAVAARRLAAAFTLAAAVVTLACRAQPPIDLGGGWLVDEIPPRGAAPRLFRVVQGTQVLIDRQVDAHKYYGTTCFAYQAPRAGVRMVFAAAPGYNPAPVIAVDSLRPWIMDTDGRRRFSASTEMDGRTMLTVEWVTVADICTLAASQKRYDPNWATTARLDPSRVPIKASVLDVNGRDSVGNSTLSEAARNAQLALVDELLRNGADVNATNDYGVSVLMSSIDYEPDAVMARLIAAGALLNAQDDDGETALMYAARHRNVEAVKLLLASGADPALRDDLGRTALTWVPDSSSRETAQLRDLLAAATPDAR